MSTNTEARRSATGQRGGDPCSIGIQAVEDRTSPPTRNVNASRQETVVMANLSADRQRVLVVRFWRSASGFWKGPKSSKAWSPTALLMVSVLLQLAIQYRLSYWGRDFFDAF